MDMSHLEQRFFGYADYLVFGGMLVVSTGIGIYHGCKCGRKKVPDTEESVSGEFLTANGQMSTLPVAISMLASFLSSITLIGQPAEVYLFGPQLWVFGVASIVAIPIIGYVFIPFYCKLRLTSAYQYFGQRFNRKLQFLASVLFSLQMVLFLALVLYAPALSLYQVTGMKTEVIVSIMYVVVIFYTTIGGMKAVVWSDCFQVLVLYISMFAVLIKGTIDFGGISLVWDINAKMGRSNFFDFNPDPTERYTFWGCFLGAASLHVSVYGANQLQVQRYLTVSSAESARKMLWINWLGWTLVVFLTVYAGMLIFARYSTCDPLTSGLIAKPDQLFPMYVMDTLGEYPGFPGLFVAGIFSAGLSTVSTGLNSLAAIWFAELDGTKLKEKLSERSSGFTVKFLSLIFGFLSFALVFIVPYMGGLAPFAISLSSFFSGSLFGLFVLGMFIPFANSVGATIGLLAGVGIVGWITIGSNIAINTGIKVFTVLPTSTEGCPSNVTLTAPLPEQDAFILYKISFLWFSLLSAIITIAVGTVASLIYSKCTTMFVGNTSDTFSSRIKPTPKSSAVKLNRCDSTINYEDSSKPEKLLLKDGNKDAAAVKYRYFTLSDYHSISDHSPAFFRQNNIIEWVVPPSLRKNDNVQGEVNKAFSSDIIVRNQQQQENSDNVNQKY